MNASELAAKMLEWEQAKRQLDTLTAEIQEAVLEIGQTQTVGNVRASYSAGRKSYNYETAIEAADLSPGSLGPFEVVTVDWRAACKGLGITDVPFAQSEPSVSVKLLN